MSNDEKPTVLNDEELEAAAGGIQIGNTWPEDTNPGSIQATAEAHPPKPAPVEPNWDDPEVATNGGKGWGREW